MCQKAIGEPHGCGPCASEFDSHLTPQKRAIRRHHYKRIKSNVFKRLKGYYIAKFLSDEELNKQAAFFTTTKKSCSCLMCINERKAFGKLTRQEEAAKLKEKEGIGELTE